MLDYNNTSCLQGPPESRKQKPFDRLTRLVQWFGIVLMCVVACVTYGIIHDQVTARICVEYFTIGHPPVFGTDDPTLLGIGWGIIATWWVGVILGVPLACGSLIGRWPKREPRTLIRPILILMASSYAGALIAGVIGWVAASNGWVVLVGTMARRVPADRHVPFLIDAWAHSASYLAGFVGGLVLMVVVLRSRARQRSANGT